MHNMTQPRPTPRTALIAGATGAAAKRLIEELLAQDFAVIGVSRRAPAATADSTHTRYSHICADLLDPLNTGQALAAAHAVTHLFYTARSPFGEGGIEDAPSNAAMLRNVLDAVEAAAPGLQHVHLVEGQKWYDVRLRPLRTPTREDDPRHMPPNFYYDQEDLLHTRQQGKAWSWSASRPHFIYDFAPERPRNMVSAIGTWAAMCAGHGLPFDFPGTHASFNALTEVTDATLLARAMVWMATDARAKSQAYNVSDGSAFRWKWLWPRLAAHFKLPVGDVRPLKLADWMKDKDAAWTRIITRHGLTPNPLSALASWNFADFFWAVEADNLADTTKLRLHGFHGVADTGEQLISYLRQYREARLLP